ncbi:MAG: membrane protein insertion efficiency factor YidD [Endomicrobium sp.]|nr:membrane protein insertion efficiency factor YidD [Endomicrobium sp.]
MKSLALFMIRCYRFVFQTFSPKCRFLPTCSVYAYQTIEMYGFLRGSWMAFKRIIRCHPFCSGGFDPVPDKKN